MLSQEMETTSWNHGNITSKEDLSLAVWLDIANINAQEKITTNIPPASDASNKAAEETSAKDKPRNKFEQMMLEDVPLLAPGVLSSMIEKSKQSQPMQQSTNPETNSKR